MGEKRYYWLKLRNDFFDSVRMKKLRGVAGGDTYTIIYLKLQLAALETEGTLIYEGVENSLAEELALLINEKPEDVGLTLNFLQSVGLCEVSKDGTLCTLPEVLLNTGSETASTQRSRAFRKRQALQCNTNATQLQQPRNVEKDIEKEKDTEKINTLSAKPDDLTIKAKLVLDALNQKTGKAFKYTDSNLRLIEARLKDYTVEDCLKVIGIKCSQWKNDPQMNKYLRPETLFNATKFGGYLNEQEVKASPQYTGYANEEEPFEW